MPDVPTPDYGPRVAGRYPRTCGVCGAAFMARKSQLDVGRGKYCSHRCAFSSGALSHLLNPDNLQKAAQKRRESVATIGTSHKSGAEHPSWRGGKEVARDRNRDAARERLRSYRARNPDKTREFAARRGGRKVGRLPRGTVKRIGSLQQWKCAVCRCDIATGYHVDHIQPLARGGIHHHLNLQLLCAACNLQKSSKDPIEFMQSRGFLL